MFNRKKKLKKGILRATLRKSSLRKSSSTSNTSSHPSSPTASPGEESHVDGSSEQPPATSKGTIKSPRSQNSPKSSTPPRDAQVNKVSSDKKITRNSSDDIQSKLENSAEDEYSFYHLIATQMRNDPQLVRDRRYHARLYRNCMVGRKACTWLAERGFAQTLEDAVKIGNKMIEIGLLRHVTSAHAFKNNYLFYRFIFSNGFADASQQRRMASRIDSMASTLKQIVHVSRDAERRAFQRTHHLKTVLLAVLAVHMFSLLLPQNFLTWFWQIFVTCCAFGFCAIGDYALEFLGTNVPPDEDSAFNGVFLGSGEGSRLSAAGQHGMRAGGDGEEHESSGFPVDDDEVQRMRAELETEFGSGFDPQIYNDAYIRSVMGAPRTPGKRRSFEYALQKLQLCIQFHLQTSGECDSQSLEEAMSAGSLYVHGVDRGGRPILWVRNCLKNWGRINVDAEIAMHRKILDGTIRGMPPGVTQFRIVADATGLGFRQMNLSLMRRLLKLLMKGYPDRLFSLSVGPVNSTLKIIASALKKLMPKRLARKIKIMGPRPFLELTKTNILRPQDVPTFFSGTADHRFEAPGKFSYEQMLQRQKALLQQAGLEATVAKTQ